MSGLRFKGLLTREERLVFLTVSLCLLGGSLFHLALSLFDLPDEINPRLEPASPFDGPGGAGPSGGYAESAVGLSGAAGAEAFAAGQSSQEKGALPAGSSAEPGATGWSGEARGLTGKLELNGATEIELDALPGIGPALARRIVEQRSHLGGFKSVDDLLAVRGIGEKTLSRFRAYVYVSHPSK